MHSFGRMLGLLRKQLHLVILVVIALCCGTWLDMHIPLFIQRMFDEAIPTKDMDLVGYFIQMTILFAALRGLCSFIQWYCNELNGQHVGAELRRNLHTKLQSLPPSWFVHEQTGALMAKFNGDVDSVQAFMGRAFLELIQAIVRIVSVLFFLLRISPGLTVKILAVVPFLVLILSAFDKKVRPAWEAIRLQMGVLTARIQENVSGIRVVKSFAQEDSEIRKFDEVNDDYRQKNLWRVHLEANYNPLLESLSALAAVFFVVFGGNNVIQGNMQFGELVAYSQYLGMLIWPARMLGWMVNMMERALGAMPRLMSILNATTTITNPPNAISLERPRGHIAFHNVSFRFDDSEHDLLHDININILPGERVAIVGGTGSGKSTLAHLLARFYDVTKGSITIDGTDIRQVTLGSLRHNIGLVPQESFLFSLSIGENIAFGHPEAPMHMIEQAARISQAAEFIDLLPQGYATPIGERGLGLSGGQRQRLSLARAVLMDPAILILDEATAAVDTETEWRIQNALHSVMEGRTTIIIAKRLSTIQGADKVILLDHGTIAEQGTPQELMQQGGLYRRLFENQFVQLGSPNEEVRHV